MNILPRTLLLPARNSKNIIAEDKIRYSEIKNQNFVYCYNIFNKIIESVGRFCEHYQSDMLITMHSLSDHIKNDHDGLYYFGIRESGVDGNSYVYNRFKNEVSNSMLNYYRKIYAVEFHRITEYDETVIIILLKDVTNGFKYNHNDDIFDMSTFENQTTQFSFKIYNSKDEIIAENSMYYDYSECCIDAGAIIDREKNKKNSTCQTSDVECYLSQIYEDGKLIESERR